LSSPCLSDLAGPGRDPVCSTDFHENRGEPPSKPKATPLPRAIDHLVIASHDLEALAALYDRLGFQVGARNRHPWGTENHIVQFDGSFLELIGLGQGFAAPLERPGIFSFAAFVGRFLARREGLAMLAMRSADAEADRIAFAARGLGAFERFDFARKARRPDGAEVDVAFSLAFAASAAMPEAGFFVCEQKFPENFWSRSAQIDPNGATGIEGVTLVHEKPEEAAEFVGNFAGAAAPRAIDGGFAVIVDGAQIECVTRAALLARFGAEAVQSDDPTLALVRVGVGDLQAVSRLLDDRAVVHRRVGEALLVKAARAHGLALVFEAGQKSAQGQ
jgi:hypothetical protein